MPRRTRTTETRAARRFARYRGLFTELLRIGARMTAAAEAGLPHVRADVERRYAETLAEIRRRQAAFDAAHPGDR